MHRNYAAAAVLGSLTLTLSASADIIYSGSLDLEVTNDGVDVSSPQTISIDSYSWEFGFVVGGPLDYAFINAQGDHAGLFTTSFGAPAAIPRLLRRFRCFRSDFGASVLNSGLPSRFQGFRFED